MLRDNEGDGVFVADHPSQIQIALLHNIRFNTKDSKASAPPLPLIPPHSFLLLETNEFQLTRVQEDSKEDTPPSTTCSVVVIILCITMIALDPWIK